MKSKVVFVAFLLAFYIAPMILAPSYTAPAIGNESNFSLSDGEGWLDGWNYRKQLSLIGETGADTDYQV
ncbi:unnamed protein product [marine sediment metagenome]|uniref:Uncharacterized protein n=1 Tax=marine sediment metagenome TaxID=412755 RepID=X1BAF9_9ZZZZ